MNKCFIVGKGRSLKGFDFNLLKDEYTLCLNHAVFAVPNPKGLCFLDPNFYPLYKDYIDEFKGDIYTIKSAGYPNAPLNVMGYTLSGVFALAEALKKFDIIYLLGYDLDVTEEYPYFGDFVISADPAKNITEEQWNKDHFSFYNDPCFSRPRLEMFEREFSQYADRVFNCNPKSAICTFPFKDVMEALK